MTLQLPKLVVYCVVMHYGSLVSYHIPALCHSVRKVMLINSDAVWDDTMMALDPRLVWANDDVENYAEDTAGSCLAAINEQDLCWSVMVKAFVLLQKQQQMHGIKSCQDRPSSCY